MRAECARRNRSVRSIAGEVGWSSSTTARRFSGDIPLNVDDLFTLAEHLGVKPSEVLRRVEDDLIRNSPERIPA
jgi:transcriptional regulator with XRE-family HTH domain